jgi:hypothetical protein
VAIQAIEDIAGCKKAFDKEPQKYIAAAASGTPNEHKH